MLDRLAPGHEIKPGTHRYSVQYKGKHSFLDKGKGGATAKKEDRSNVEIRTQKVAAMVANLGLCLRCVRESFPDVKLPGDRNEEEEKTFCPAHKSA
jgi:hypothetical protein